MTVEERREGWRVVGEMLRGLKPRWAGAATAAATAYLQRLVWGFAGRRA